MGSGNGVAAVILPAGIKRYLTRKYPGWQSLLRKGEIRARVWWQQFVTALVKLSILAVLVAGAYITALYFLGGIWALFENTFIGSQYTLSVDPVRAAEISRVLSLDLKFLGVTVTLLAVLVSVVVGVISQLTMLRRFFYVGRSALVKLGWWTLVSGGVARQLGGYYQMDFYLALGLCFLPTLCIFSPVLAAAGKLLPELNLLLFLEKRHEKREIQNLKDDIAALLNDEFREDLEGP